MCDTCNESNELDDAAAIADRELRAKLRQETANARVQEGVKLLDSLGADNTIPADWHNAVDTDALDMYSMRYCVLGQIFDGISMEDFKRKTSDGGDARMRLGYDYAEDLFAERDLPDVYEGGFNTVNGIWTELRKAWVTEIDKRKSM